MNASSVLSRMFTFLVICINMTVVTSLTVWLFVVKWLQMGLITFPCLMSVKQKRIPTNSGIPANFIIPKIIPGLLKTQPKMPTKLSLRKCLETVDCILCYVLTVVYPPSGLMSAFPLFPAKKRRFVLYDFGTP